MENELEGLRRIIKEKDRNIDMERAIQKKRTDFEKAIRELQDENSRHREKIVYDFKNHYLMPFDRITWKTKLKSLPRKTIFCDKKRKSL